MVVVLPGAVGPEQAEDLALVDLEVEGVEGGLLLAAPEVAVDLGQVAGFDDDILGHGALLRPYSQRDNTVTPWSPEMFARSTRLRSHVQRGDAEGEGLEVHVLEPVGRIFSARAS